MAKKSFRNLSKVTKGAVFVVTNPKTERCAAWFGGTLISIYDYGGGLVDSVCAPLYCGADAVRAYARRLLGKGADDAR